MLSGSHINSALLFAPLPINNDHQVQSQQTELQQGEQSPRNGNQIVKLSLASLIGQAIMSTDAKQARLSTIYKWIVENHGDHYKLNHGGWQNSIRHNLTINKAFMRVNKSPADQQGKGSYWKIAPDHMSDFENGIFIGKIRSSEYRTTTKSKSNKRRISAPELPAAVNRQPHNVKRFQVASNLNLNDALCSNMEQNSNPHSLPNMFQQPTLPVVEPQQDWYNQINVNDVQYGQYMVQPFVNNQNVNYQEYPYVNYAAQANSILHTYQQYFANPLSNGAPQIGRSTSPDWQSNNAHIEQNHPDCACGYCVTLPLPANSISPNADQMLPPVTQPTLQIPVAQHPALSTALDILSLTGEHGHAAHFSVPTPSYEAQDFGDMNQYAQ